jgi:hypothetical protein
MGSRAWMPGSLISYLKSEVYGGAEGDRTLDLRIANATLSQLSYRPTTRRAILASGIGTSREESGNSQSARPWRPARHR